jgi:very-short-patch-repair endonuclease
VQLLAFAEWLRNGVGVVHTADAAAAGYSKHAIAQAIAAGDAIRIRRSWIALPHTDARLLAAARAGGRLSCLDAASRLGAWVPPHDGTVHLAMHPTASRVVGDGLTLHWGDGPSPVPPHTIEDHIVNILFHVAKCQPERLAFAVWESVVRLRLAAPEVLRRVRWRTPVAVRLAEAVSVLSDSGVESIFVRGIRRLGLPVRQQVWIDGHPLDAQIGDALLVQLDGFAHHSSAADRRRDIRADARLALRGYTVLRFDWYQVLFDWPYVERTVLAAVAQGLHLMPAAARR